MSVKKLYSFTAIWNSPKDPAANYPFQIHQAFPANQPEFSGRVRRWPPSHLYLGQSNYSVQCTLAKCNLKVPARYDWYLSSCRMLSGRGRKKKTFFFHNFNNFPLYFTLIPLLTDFYVLCICYSSFTRVINHSGDVQLRTQLLCPIIVSRHAHRQQYATGSLPFITLFQE